MVIDNGTSVEALIDRAADQVADSPKRRKRRVRVGRKQDKFPRWVRMGLWLGMPAVLWAGVYLIGRALL